VYTAERSSPSKTGSPSSEVGSEVSSGSISATASTPRLSKAHQQLVSKNGLFEPFTYNNDQFTKTGSDKTKEKLKNKTVFPQERCLRTSRVVF
jgi:hypothetical protein